VLHDASLDQFIAHRTQGQGNASGYTRERGYAQGMEGINQTWQDRLHPQVYNRFDLPLTKRLVDVSLGMIVHSEFAKQRLLGQRPSLLVQVIPELMELQTGQSNRAKLNWPDEAIIFASLGQVTPHKQIGLILQILSQLRETHDNIYYLIVGEDQERQLRQLVAENGWQSWVTCTGYVAGLPAFIDWLLAADVVINLRQPTLGETSAAALRALGAGKPLIVFDHGWYSEIPDVAALKVPLMAEDKLATAVTQLAESTSLRQKMGKAGQQYIQATCVPEIVSTSYQTFLQQIMDQYQVSYA